MKEGLLDQSQPVRAVFQIHMLKRVFFLLSTFLIHLTFFLVLYTVEFQKRGLPHCHLLLWIQEHSRVRTNAQIDRYVSAELPNPASDPEGYRIVTELMMHGPCGLVNRSAVCMKGGDTCTKGPKTVL